MRIIITPAKRMLNEVEYFTATSTPMFMDQANILLKHLQALSLEQLQRVLGCSLKIAQVTYDHYQKLSTSERVVPAIFAYQGIQYQTSALHVLQDEDYRYLKDHVIILSGFYGLLRPFDGVVPYRLELNNKLVVGENKNLYQFWGAKIYQALIRDESLILDLGAKQYTTMLQRYMEPTIKYVKCTFYEDDKKGLREIGVYVKIARGAMLRYLIEIKAKSFAEVKTFKELGYVFNSSLSNERNYVFVRKH